MSVFTFTCLLLIGSSAPGADADGDRDGLSDFLELHKYGTNPKKADSDGDGIDDGDWLERREYAYTVRSVVQVMKPVTIEFLNDDFQDARLLFDGKDFAELEVIHYPFNTVNDAIGSSDKWRRPKKDLKVWLEAGETSDWTSTMRKDLLAALAKDGIDVAKLGDREVVEQVSRWLMKHAEYHDGFSSFITSFDEAGAPYIAEDLIDAAERDAAEAGMTIDEQWEREVSACGMFNTGRRGSCTSSAIYMSGCMRAVGIPTRTVLCIPLVDANDEREVELVQTRLTHHALRQLVMTSTRKAKGSWTSHTFNEVWVDGRWRRLNYDNLGQNILDAHFLGLMTHIATFQDWADARMPDTVGRRSQLSVQSELFGGPNPYSTISLSDSFGVHCTLDNPIPDERTLAVGDLRWTDDTALPAEIVSNCERRGRFGLIATVENVTSQADWRKFLGNADLRVWLEAPGNPRLGIGFDGGCWWCPVDGGTAHIYLPLGAGDKRDLVEGVDYQAVARNENDGFAWKLDLKIRR